MLFLAVGGVAFRATLGAIGATFGAVRVQVSAIGMHLGVLRMRDCVIGVSRFAGLLGGLFVSAQLRSIACQRSLIACGLVGHQLSAIRLNARLVTRHDLRFLARRLAIGVQRGAIG